MTGDATHAATAVSRWLLDADVDGIGLTKTHVLQRETVREAARRWPWSWNHELFGPPHREAELSVLEAVHRGLRRMRLLRRQRDTLLTTARGRELLADPPALFDALHADLGAGDGIDKDAWPAIERVLAFGERLTVDGLFEQVGPVLFLQGWRDADCAPLTAHTLFSALVPLLSLAGGYGTIGRTFDTNPLTIELSEAGRRLASRPSPTGAHAAPPGAGAVVLDAELVNVRGVRARIAILEHQHLTAVHDTLQEAFG